VQHLGLGLEVRRDQVYQQPLVNVLLVVDAVKNGDRPRL
jgi:hypothetical protein